LNYIRFGFAFGFALAVIAPCGRSQEVFPEWKVAPRPLIGIEGQWRRADDVIVGDVSNVIAMGTQKIDSPPWPVSPSVREIYWCEADFRADAVVKGSLPPMGKKFLWGEIRPGCNLGSFRYGYRETSPPSTRVWFLRQEGEYLRPVVDGGGAYFVAFHWKWTDVPKEAVPRLFALLALDPVAIDLGPEEYYMALSSVEVARSILGDKELVVQLKALATRPNAELNKQACGYLEAELRESCKK
jgi:hypothetical protein